MGRNPRVGSYYACGAALLGGVALAAWPLGAPLLWPAVSLAIVASGYFWRGPRIFAKADGRVPFLVQLLLGPVIAGHRLSQAHYARLSDTWNAVTPTVRIGRRLDDREAGQAVAEGVTAVLDVTAESSEAPRFRAVDYRNIRILDLTAPTLEEMDEAALFIEERSSRGIVYVHCKAGYSRSAAAVGAYLLHSGKAASAREAEEQLRRVRPSIVIRPEIHDVLTRYAELVRTRGPAKEASPRPPEPCCRRGRVAAALAIAAVLPGLALALVFTTRQFYPEHRPPRTTPAQLGLTAQELRMKGPDGVGTVGWYFAPNRSPAPAVILVHGYGGRRDRMLPVAAALVKAGMGVVTMDLRHHGEAEDAPVTFGVRESGDVLPYLEFVRARPEHAGRPLGILGCSLGAVTALRVASLHKEIAAVVADSPFDSLSTQARWRLEQSLPPWLAAYGWVFVMAAGCAATRLGPAEWEVAPWVAAIAPRPILFIHGVDDSSIPVAATRRLAAGAPGPVETWFVDGADHLDYVTGDAGRYNARVVEFFRRHL